MKLYKLISTLFCSLLLLTACENYDFETDASYNKLFRTSKVTIEDLDATYVDLSWNKVPNADYYILELSEDELAFTTNLQKIGIDKSIKTNTYKIEQLLGSTQYSVRIKAVSEKGIPDSEYATLAFKTKAEQALNEVSAITGNSTTVTWQPGLNVDKVIILSGEETIQSIVLTSEQLAEGKLVVTNLKEATAYQALICLGNLIRGKRSFETTENYPDGYEIINLTAADNINTILSTKSGNVVAVIPHSTEMVFTEGVIIPETINSIIFWGATGGTSKATLKSLTFTAQGTKGQIKFYNLNINPQEGYLFNQQDIDSDIREVIIEKCIIGKNSGVIRAKGSNAITIGKAVINQSIINGCTKALFAFKEATNGKIPIVELTSSTVSSVTQQYVYAAQPIAATITDCTLYNIGTTKAFMELAEPVKTSKEASITIKNTIIAKSIDTTKSIKACNVKGLVSSENTYITSDCVFDIAYGLENATSYANTADDLFENPTEGYFKIKDPNFTVKCGDTFHWAE